MAWPVLRGYAAAGDGGGRDLQVVAGIDGGGVGVAAEWSGVDGAGDFSDGPVTRTSQCALPAGSWWSTAKVTTRCAPTWAGSRSGMRMVSAFW